MRQKDGSRLRYVFDAGVHDVSGLGERGPVRNLMRQLDIEEEVDWRRMDHEYAIDGIHIRVPRDPKRFAAKLGEILPTEQAAIHAFFTEIELVYRELYADIETTGGVPTAPRTVEGLMAYPATHPHAYQWMEQPFVALLDQYFTRRAAEGISLRADRLFDRRSTVADRGRDGPDLRLLL